MHIDAKVLGNLLLILCVNLFLKRGRRRSLSQVAIWTGQMPLGNIQIGKNICIQFKVTK